MKQKKDISSNGRLSGVEAALRRAGQKARELAAKTGTPLVIYSDGKIKKLRINSRPATRSSHFSRKELRSGKETSGKVPK